MATKLTPSLKKDLDAIGIVVKTGTEEEARKKLIEFLAKNEVDGVDGDNLKDLIEMATVFYEPAAEEEAAEEEEVVEEEEEVAEEELDQLAEEVATTKPATTKKTPPPIAPKTSGIAKPAPAAVKPAPVAAKKTTRLPAAEGVKFDARNDESHLAYLEPFKDFFPDDQYQYDILKQGFTIRLLGENAKTTVMNYDELKIDAEGKLIGNFYTNRFKSVDELKETLQEEYHDREIGMFRGESHPSIKRFTQDEVISVLTDTEFIEKSLGKANEKDAKMGANRAKLEQTMTATTTTKPAPVAAKPAPAPVKPAAKPAPAPVAKKPVVIPAKKK